MRITRWNRKKICQEKFSSKYQRVYAIKSNIFIENDLQYLYSYYHGKFNIMYGFIV